ncbi:MAG: 2-oxoacid:acceptor oxidoreductase subunit alpha, partial [Thermoproteota archaeon]
HLSESYKTVGAFSEDVRLERGDLILDHYEGEYKRYLITETGVSPRAIPGIEGIIVKQDGSEHNERGLATADANNAKKMQDKRMRKMKYLKEEISRLQPIKLYGEEEADLTIIGWGSTKGAILEALILLKEMRIRANFIQVVYLWPFPDLEVKKALKNTKKLFLVENNKTAQLGSLLREFICLEPDKTILKYDGRPFVPEEIVEQIEEAI